jgi:acetyltransferase-like isoleucine patch superfamily enzyme
VGSKATLEKELSWLPLKPSQELQVLKHRPSRGYIHPTALVETERVGPDTRIWAFTHVSNGAVVGANCNIGSHCYVESGARIGDGVTVKNGNYLWEGVTLCNGAFVGPQVVFTNDLHPRSPRLPQAAHSYRDDDWLSPSIVGEGASIGGGAVIRAGVSLKRFCMVGAGAVVTKTVPAHALVMGVPARIAGWVCCCGAKLAFEREIDTRARCEECLCEFESIEGELQARL